MEKQIRNILENRVDAVKNKNVEKATAAYSEDVISYDVVGQLKFTGIKALQKRLREWLSSLDEIIEYEIKDVKITASPGTAFCSSLNHINAKTTDGRVLDMYWRETTCYLNANGKVRVTHSHSSVPFDANSGQASIELKPSAEQEAAPEEEPQKSPGELAKSSYIAFQNRQREVLYNLFSDDFNFSSPNDKGLNKDQFFKICYPFSEKVIRFEFMKVVEDGNDVFVTYRCSAKSQPDFENTELLTIKNGKIRSVKVFFGGSIS